MMMHTKYQGLGHMVLEKKIFFTFFPNIGLSKTCDPQGGPFLDPGINFEQTW